MFVFWASIPTYLKSKSNDRSPYWRPTGKRSAQTLARRAAIALSPRGILFAWTPFLPSILVFLVATVITFGSGSGPYMTGFRWDILGGYLVGAVLAAGSAYVFGLGKAIRKDLQDVTNHAAKALARRGLLLDAERVLLAAADMPIRRVRLAAAIALRYVATEKGNATLNRLLQDGDRSVRDAAHSSLENIAGVLSGEYRLSVLPLEELCAEFEKVDSQLDIMIDTSHRAQLMLRYYRMSERFEEIIYSQLPLRRAYPHLFCMQCLCRTEEKVFKDWAWVRCIRCKDVFGLQPGVAVVTGQIGGVQDWELRNGNLEISLWDPEERKARGAEIDRLEVVGLQDFSYDWAVTAVIERLRAHALAGDCHVPIKLLHSPPLTENTLKLLRLVDPNMVEAK